MRRFIFTLLFLVGLGGCSKTQSEETMLSEIKTWNVYKNNVKVLIVSNKPGLLISTASIPPGTKPAKHPFLSATALEPSEENDLKAILDKAKNLEDFLSLLKDNGYRVEKE